MSVEPLVEDYIRKMGPTEAIGKWALAYTVGLAPSDYDALDEFDNKILPRVIRRLRREGLAIRRAGDWIFKS